MDVSSMSFTPPIVLVEKSYELVVVVHPSNVIGLARQHLLVRDF